MKLAPFLLGAISAQSGDDADRWDSTDFTLTDDIFTYAQDKEPSGDGRACSTELAIQAVTCWESNNMGNLDHYVTTNDDNFGWQNIHHGHDQGAHTGATAGNNQGSQESTVYGQVAASTSPNYQVGTYNAGFVAGTNKIDYHSALAFDNRYSGCIYEATGWDYNADTYNTAFRAGYGWDGTALTDSGVDMSSGQQTIRPNWWHYFNAHILNVGQFDSTADSYGKHFIVMANPAYEGLGYLNWITTFAKVDTATAPAIDTNWDTLGISNGNAGSRGFNVVNIQDTSTDLYSGGYAFRIGHTCDNTRRKRRSDDTWNIDKSVTTDGTTSIFTAIETNTQYNSSGPVAGTFFSRGAGYAHYQVNGTPAAGGDGMTDWYSYLMHPAGNAAGDATYKDTDLAAFDDQAAGGITMHPWMSHAAVSSFPHNDLGQDFRFNLRILHYGGRGFPYADYGNAADSVLTQALGTLTAGTLNTGDWTVMANSQLAQDSYYWYKVNTIMIDFPSYVRCPRFYKNIAFDDADGITNDKTGTIEEGILRDELLSDTFRCMDSGNYNGHRGWDSSVPYSHTATQAHTTSLYGGLSATYNPSNVNSPYYIETLTEENGAAYAGLPVDLTDGSAAVANDAAAGALTAVTDADAGFICGPNPPFAGAAGGAYHGNWFKCGQRYKVHGLMNTYDEYAQLEYGTMQEIWFQFYYHYAIRFDITSTANAGNSAVTSAYDFNNRDSNTNRGTGVTTEGTYHNGEHGDVDWTRDVYANGQTAPSAIADWDHLHNYPNILFNAFELKGIRFFCDKTNSFNSNQCFHSTNEVLSDTMADP